MPLDISPSDLKISRMWYYVGGALSLLVGLFAISRPCMASVAIEQLIGIVFIASGIVLLLSSFFGKAAKKHRIIDLLSSILRLAVGIALIAKALAGIIALTLIVAAVFIAEGIFWLIFAFKLKGKNPAWLWILANALAAFVLGGMLLAKFPSDAAWAVGLLFGINSAFIGISLIVFALSLHRAEDA